MKLQSIAALAVLTSMLALCASSARAATPPRYSVALINPDAVAMPAALQLDGLHVNIAARNEVGDIAGSVTQPPVGYQVVATGIDAFGMPYEDRLMLGARAAIVRDGQLTVLGTMGRAESFGVAINAQGQMVGNAMSSIVRVSNDGTAGADFRWQTPADARAFLYENGQITDLGTLGGSTSQATTINARGDVLGHSLTAGDQASEAFLYRDGKMTSLGLEGGMGSQAIALNEAGDVAGTVLLADGFQAFINQEGVTHALGTFGGTSSSARALSPRGAVAGDVRFGPKDQRSFVYVEGQATLLPSLGTTVGGFEHMTVIDVNDRGDVIGTALIGEYEVTPYLYSGGQIYDLRTLVDVDTGPFGQLLEIQDDGSILAAFGDGTVLLSPVTAVPEPVSALMMLMGLGMIAGLHAYSAFRPRG